MSICSGQNFMFHLAFVLTNGFYFGVLIWKHFPVLIPKHLSEIFVKMFGPLKVSKKVTVETIVNGSSLKVLAS